MGGEIGNLYIVSWCSVEIIRYNVSNQMVDIESKSDAILDQIFSGVNLKIS